MAEGVDYHLGESPTVVKGTPKKIITLTLNCAKKIAMRQNNKQGDLVCDYFILMEKALRNMGDWLLVTEPEKEGYKELCKQLKNQYQKTHEGKNPSSFILVMKLI